MTDAPEVSAGWYPDPLGEPKLRWWNGHGWTFETTEAPVDRLPTPVVDVAADRQPVTSGIRTSPVGAGRTTLLESPVTIPPPEADEGPAAPPSVGVSREELGRPGERGWGGVAVALHSVQAAAVPVLITISIESLPTIVVDTRYRAFEWSLPIASLPERPQGVQVGVDLVDLTRPAAFELPGHSLDALLWRVGRFAFPERIAPWLPDASSFRMTRWPNLTMLQPGMDQMRQMALLANAPFSIAALATATDASLEDTRSLINALSLVGALEPVESVETAPVAVRARSGLFQRLRTRLGL